MKNLNIICSVPKTRNTNPKRQAIQDRFMNADAERWALALSSVLNERDAKDHTVIAPLEPDAILNQLPRVRIDLLACFVYTPERVAQGIGQIIYENRLKNVLVLTTRPIAFNELAENYHSLPSSMKKLPSDRIWIPGPEMMEADRLQIREMNSFHHFDMEQLVTRLLDS